MHNPKAEEEARAISAGAPVMIEGADTGGSWGPPATLLGEPHICNTYEFEQLYVLLIVLGRQQRYENAALRALSWLSGQRPPSASGSHF